MSEPTDAQVWEQFCDGLKVAGQQILRPEAPADEITRAEGWRYLTRLLRIGLDMHVEHADPDFPGFFAPSNETAKIGADNPDNLYLMAKINGANEYRIQGQRGTVHYLSVGSQKGGYETDGRMIQTGFLDGKDLKVGPDGSFEIVISAEPTEGNWLKVEPDSTTLIVRQTFEDRRIEKPATLSIERFGSSSKPEPLDAPRLSSGLARTSAFVNGTATVFADWAQSYLARPNELPPADQALCQKAGGDPNIFYYHACWELSADQALLVHLPSVPDCRFWNFQINNWWMESLDYRHHQICLNQNSARFNADGSVTMLLTQRDPEHPNWLEATGHRRGTMCFRWVSAERIVQPETAVIPLMDIQNHRWWKELA